MNGSWSYLLWVLQAIFSICTNIISQTLSTLPIPTADNQDPLYRLFSREGEIGRKLLNQVKKDVGDVIKVCEGEIKKQTICEL